VEINEMIEKLLAELGQLVRTESVVGKPIQTGDTTVIPVSKISFGFGGGGAQIEPVAFIVIHDGKAQLLNVQDKEGFGIGKVIDLIPEIIDKIKDLRGNREKKEKETKE